MPNNHVPAGLSRSTKEVIGSVRRVLATTVQHLPAVDSVDGLVAAHEILKGQANVLLEVIDSLQCFSESTTDGHGNIISGGEGDSNV